MKIGYARVSTDDQHLDGQTADLKAAGCEKIYEERVSGGRWNRAQLQEMLRTLRKGDEVVVTKLDRLSRSVLDTLTLLQRIEEAGAGFRSLAEGIETVTPAGRMLMQMIAAFAEYERAMIRSRTREGLEAAKRRGAVLGRKRSLTPDQEAKIRLHVGQGDWTAADAARTFKVHPSTITRLMQRV